METVCAGADDSLCRVLTVMDLAASRTGPCLESNSLGSATMSGFGGMTFSPKVLQAEVKLHIMQLAT